jgi:hypothetical protein
VEDFKNVDAVFYGNEGVDEEEVTLLNSFSDDPIAKIIMDGDELLISFESGREITISDHGQSCCEHRYMHCEDEGDFEFHEGAFLRFVQIVAGGDDEDGYEVHETEYCNIFTSKGVIQLVCHNEHNGYYGGFCVRIVEK